eukprot:2771949-Pleurochrysis_carterae.AAC.1
MPHGRHGKLEGKWAVSSRRRSRRRARAGDGSVRCVERGKSEGGGGGGGSSSSKVGSSGRAGAG